MDGLYPNFTLVTIELRCIYMTVTFVRGGHAGLFAGSGGRDTEPEIWYYSADTE